MERLDTLSLNHNVITELGPGWFEGRLPCGIREYKLKEPFHNIVEITFSVILL
jgi:hypothetical protein